MRMSQPFSPTRLTAAREFRGVTKKALAEAIGVTAANISAYENGQWAPNVEALKAISKELEFPMTWFWQDELSLVDSAAPTFRAQSRMTAQTRMRALKTWDFAALIRDYLDDEFNLPELSIPDFSADLLELKSSSEPVDSLKFAENAAENLRDDWRLGDGPIPNMVHLMESKGISIFWTNIESHTVDACCHWANDQPIVLLNSNVESGERARFNAAHELGHLVLHREELRKNVVIESSSEEIDGDFEPKPSEESVVEEKAIAAKRRELEAHRFASAFLLPFRSWSQETPIHSEPSEFLRLKPRWKTSVQAMIRRSFDLGILSEFQYESAMKQVSIRGWRKQEPDALFVEQSQVHKELFDLLRNRGESPLDLALDLHLQASILETLMPVSREFTAKNSKTFTRSTVNPVLPFPSREEF